MVVRLRIIKKYFGTVVVFANDNFLIYRELEQE